MRPTGADEERVVREVTRACAADLDPLALRERIVRAFERAVPHESCCAFETDPSTGLITRTSLDRQDPARNRYFLEHVYLTSELALHNWMWRSDELAVEDWARSDRALGRSFRSPEALDTYAAWDGSPRTRRRPSGGSTSSAPAGASAGRPPKRSGA